MTIPPGGVWRTPGFRRLFAAQTISRWGDTFNNVALVILVFRLTGSGLRVAGTVAFEILPVLLLAPLAGVLADRLPRHRVMVAADLVRAALVGVLVVGPHELPVIYAVAFGLSAGSVFFNPASGALLPTLVEETRLVAANSALWSAAVLSQIALAPLAGVLVGSAGPRAAFGVNAASFVVSAVLLRRLPYASVAGAPEADRRRPGEGIALVARMPLVRLLAVVQGLAALSAGATSALLVVLAERRLGVGPSGFGLLLAAIAVGAVAGPFVLRLRVTDVRRPALVFGPYVLRGGVDLVLASTTHVGVALPALALYGVGTSTGMIAYNSLVQSRLPDEVRGRAFALFDVVWQSGRLLSLLAGGLVVDAVGVRVVYLAGGLLLLVAAAIGFARASTLRGP